MGLGLVPDGHARPRTGRHRQGITGPAGRRAAHPSTSASGARGRAAGAGPPQAYDVVARKVHPRHPDRAHGHHSSRVTLAPLHSLQSQGALPARSLSPGTGTQLLKFAQPYLDSGFSSAGNAGHPPGILGEAPTVDLGDPQVTGTVAPKFPLKALSRRAGPVGGPIAALASGKVKAADVRRAHRRCEAVRGLPARGTDRVAALDVGSDVPQMVTHTLDGVSSPACTGRFPCSAVAPAPSSRAAADPRRPLPREHWASRGPRVRMEIDATTELVPPVDPLAPVMRTRTPAGSRTSR